MKAILAAIVLVVACGSPSPAQVRASEAAIVQQTVDGTKITVEYSRPAVRGRNPFGGVVHWGERWTPGANWATTLDVDKDIRLAGHPLAKGKYALWMVPREHAEWTVIVHPKARVYHMTRPDTTEAVLRFALKPEQGAHVERLTFEFPIITPDGTVLALRWGTTMVQLPIRVQPSRPVAIDAADMQRMAGSYALTGARGNSNMEVFVENGKLRARGGPMMLSYDPNYDLIPVTKDRFNPLFYRGGQPFDTEDFAIVFVDSAAAMRVEWRGVADRVFAQGTKKK
jgi:hypothetical protein